MTEITLLVMTDGRRHCIEQTIPSAIANLEGPITRRVIHDDSGDGVYRSWLAGQFPTFEIIGGTNRVGFGGAIRRAWAHLAGDPEGYVFHLEDDFLFNRPVSLAALVAVLEQQPELLQLVLLRQPWNPAERDAGGIIQCHPEAFTPRAGWIEHRRFFSTNPSLYRRSLCRRVWPSVSFSEGMFTHKLLVDPELRFGFWGAGEEWVTHIGAERAGVGY